MFTIAVDETTSSSADEMRFTTRSVTAGNRPDTLPFSTTIHRCKPVECVCRDRHPAVTFLFEVTAGRLRRNGPISLGTRLCHVDGTAITKFVSCVVDTCSGDIGNVTHVLSSPFAEADERDERPGGGGTEAERFELFDGRGSCLVGRVTGH